MSHHDKAKDKPGPDGGVRLAIPDADKDTEGHKLPDMKPGEAAVGPDQGVRQAIPDEDEGKPGPEDFVRN